MKRPARTTLRSLLRRPSRNSRGEGEAFGDGFDEVRIARAEEKRARRAAKRLPVYEIRVVA